MFRTTLTSLFFLVSASVAFADSFLPPCPYVVKSADGTKHFVMLTKQTEMECRGRSEAAAAKALRTKYKSSGVYDNGDPTKPLWTFDEEWWLVGAQVANDGSHVVQTGSLGRDPSVTAFTIYKDGKILRSFKVDEFVRDESAINYTTSTIQWSKKLYLDDRKSTFIVETNDGITYSIDLATGKISNESSGPTGERTGSNTSDVQPSGRFCFGAFIFLVFGFALVFRRPNRIRAVRSTPSPRGSQ